MDSPPLAKKQKLVKATQEEDESLSDKHEVHASPGGTETARHLLEIEEKLCATLGLLIFPPSVTHIYDPLSYASVTHSLYVTRYAPGHKKILFLGMNPGPFGMAQNGVPFGDTEMVRGWLGISGEVGKPDREHPNRPIHGLHCSKAEVSGTRFWGLFRNLCSSPAQFFKNCFVHNYCPFCFMANTGKNITPPMLKGEVKVQLQDACDHALLEAIQVLGVEWVVGIGKYGADRAKAILRQTTNTKSQKKPNDVETFILQDFSSGSCDSVSKEIHVCAIMHPSPINPAANKDWAGLVTKRFEQLGILQLITAQKVTTT